MAVQEVAVQEVAVLPEVVEAVQEVEEFVVILEVNFLWVIVL